MIVDTLQFDTWHVPSSLTAQSFIPYVTLVICRLFIVQFVTAVILVVTYFFSNSNVLNRSHFYYNAVKCNDAVWSAAVPEISLVIRFNFTSTYDSIVQPLGIILLIMMVKMDISIVFTQLIITDANWLHFRVGNVEVVCRKLM